MSCPLWDVAHLGDVVEDLLQWSIDLDTFFDAHNGYVFLLAPLAGV
jgi:hypothetical protein